MCPPFPEAVAVTEPRSHHLECRLLRSDGSEWTVEELLLSRERILVTAILRNGAVPSGRLEMEPLEPEDELVWVDDGGDVVRRIPGAEG